MIKLTNVERGGIRTAYSAGIESNGTRVGYVQKVVARGTSSYYAFAGGKCVARARTLREMLSDLREAEAAGELGRDEDEA